MVQSRRDKADEKRQAKAAVKAAEIVAAQDKANKFVAAKTVIQEQKVLNLVRSRSSLNAEHDQHASSS